MAKGRTAENAESPESNGSVLLLCALSASFAARPFAPCLKLMDGTPHPACERLRERSSWRKMAAVAPQLAASASASMTSAVSPGWCQ